MTVNTSMILQTIPAAKAEIVQEYLELSARIESVNSAGRQEVLSAFAGGFLSLGLVAGVFRMFAEQRNRRQASSMRRLAVNEEELMSFPFFGETETSWGV